MASMADENDEAERLCRWRVERRLPREAEALSLYLVDETGRGHALQLSGEQAEQLAKDLIAGVYAQREAYRRSRAH